MRAREALLFFGLGVSAVLAGAAAYTSYPLVVSLSGSEIFGPIQQNGSDHTVTASQLKNYVLGTNVSSALYDASTVPNGIVFFGTYSNAVIDITSSSSAAAMIVNDNQDICWDISNQLSCLNHYNGQLVYVANGVRIFSVSDSTGNAIFKGTVTQSGSP
jgi:hypothetical protein